MLLLTFFYLFVGINVHDAAIQPSLEAHWQLVGWDMEITSKIENSESLQVGRD